MNDELPDLASAYLDGEVTADERAAVETDRELLADVERLRQVRAIVADIDPPSISVREQHLAAALGAWDRLPDRERLSAATGNETAPDSLAAAGVAAMSTPVSIERRRSRWTRPLLAAAATVAVVAAGAVVVGVLDGERDDADDIAVDGAATDEPSGDEAAGESGATRDELAARAGEEFAGGDDEADVAVEAPLAEEGAESVDAATQAVVESELAGEEAAGPVIGGPEAPPPDGGELDVLETPDELAAFAAFALDAPAGPDAEDVTEDVAGDDPAASSDADGAGASVPTCDLDVIAGPASYRGQTVAVGIDLDRQLAVAYLPDDCTVIDRAPLP